MPHTPIMYVTVEQLRSCTSAILDIACGVVARPYGLDALGKEGAFCVCATMVGRLVHLPCTPRFIVVLDALFCDRVDECAIQCFDYLAHRNNGARGKAEVRADRLES